MQSEYLDDVDVEDLSSVPADNDKAEDELDEDALIENDKEDDETDAMLVSQVEKHWKRFYGGDGTVWMTNAPAEPEVPHLTTTIIVPHRYGQAKDIIGDAVWEPKNFFQLFFTP